MDLRMPFGRALVGLLAIATTSCLLAQTMPATTAGAPSIFELPPTPDLPPSTARGVPAATAPTIPAATAPGIPLSTAPAMPVATAPETAPAPAPRVPAPTGAALQDALKLVRDVYEHDLAAARKPAEKDALATKLLQAGTEEKDPSARYVLLTMARDMANEAGDLALAMSATAELCRGFELDSLKARTDTTLAASRNVSTDPLRRRFVETAHALLDEVLAADRYDFARQISDAAVSVARAGSDSVATKTAAADAQHVRDLDLASHDLEKPLAALSANPADPDANLKVGRFRCFIKGDWNKGLPMLAKGGDPALKDLAQRDLAGSTGAADQAKLGDDWWDLAEKQTGWGKSVIRAHAAALYQAALPTMEKGLARARTEKRVLEAQADQVPATTKPDERTISPEKLAQARNVWDSMITTGRPGVKTLVVESRNQIVSSDSAKVGIGFGGLVVQEDHGRRIAFALLLMTNNTTSRMTYINSTCEWDNGGMSVMLTCSVNQEIAPGSTVAVVSTVPPTLFGTGNSVAEVQAAARAVKIKSWEANWARGPDGRQTMLRDAPPPPPGTMPRN